MKILFKLAITRRAVFSSKCTQIICRPGSARTRWGSLQRSPDPLAGFKGPTSKEGEGRGGKGMGGEGRETTEGTEARGGDETGGKGTEGEGRRSGLPAPYT